MKDLMTERDGFEGQIRFYKEGREDELYINNQTALFDRHMMGFMAQELADRDRKLEDHGKQLDDQGKQLEESGKQLEKRARQASALRLAIDENSTSTKQK